MRKVVEATSTLSAHWPSGHEGLYSACFPTMMLWTFWVHDPKWSIPPSFLSAERSKWCKGSAWVVTPVGLSFSPLFSPKTDPQFPLPFICFVLVLIFQWFSLFLEIQDLFLCMTPLTVYVTGYLSEGHSWAESANNFSAKPWKWYYTCSLCCAGDTWRVLSHFWWCWVKIIWMLC